MIEQAQVEASLPTSTVRSPSWKAGEDALRRRATRLTRVSLVLLAIAAALVILSFATFRRAGESIDRARDVLASHFRLLVALADAETTQRDFLVTGDDHALAA